ncbi:MAG: hypothetical protein ACRBF0_20600 [Calditrichia bacterium]
MSEVRPTLSFSCIDWLIIGFCLFFIGTECLSWLSTNGAWDPLNPRNPYFEYYANPVIRLLVFGAIVIDLLIIFSIVSLKQSGATSALRIMVLLLIVVAIGLIWTELWFGSTFYYGEVRDKQGLPFSVNNFGLLGSVLFTAYFVWLLPTDKKKSPWITALKLIIIIALISGQIALFNSLEEAWKLWQS